MNKLKAIETKYNGHRFRSRLEARWAVFLDEAGIEWIYEGEGFDLGDVGYYLPDFYLPRLEFYFEVKPSDPDGDEITKLVALANLSEKDCAFLIGPPNARNPELTYKVYAGSSVEAGAQMLDFGPYAFCQCPLCRTFSFEYEGRIGRCCGHVGESEHYHNTQKLVEASDKATMARFEHGETP